MTKKALGKGLKAFIPEEYGILKEERYAELDIEKLKPSSLQPRLKFNDDSIDELASSIKESGVLQPVLVVPEGNHYTIIVGERRWRAAQKIGLKKIPSIIRKMPKAQQLETSLVENLQREDLNPLEVALAYQKLTQELNYTQQEIADKVGKDRASVANYLRLLNLPKEIQDYLAEEKISMGHARALLALENTKAQLSLARQVVQNQLSVRQVEQTIQKLKPGPQVKKHRPPDPDLMALQEELIRLLGTKVSISGSQNRGVIKIHYFSTDELNQIYEKIKE
ncbi:MAG: ParB/RepB/Spo0J family partition protein [Candidatus Aminicenantes bacterium]|nr:ParB/RepB/Spo0J family partition protein [Candidatus Aminicenantes bacterium]MDH5465982.1 ParB/RepB/Spo0J family partition protein [Candidatus Aminicenantes bacterium]MDH5704417.1 ParB/RepB/Spo0J family partition protein [Candidatus Aminicenantes bacterium]